MALVCLTEPEGGTIRYGTFLVFQGVHVHSAANLLTAP
jgi:hypothetical protein